MSKRFVETSLFDDPWFMSLSNPAKLFWVFLFTKCDHAGIVQRNEQLFTFYLGGVDIPSLYEEIGERVVQLDDTYLFLPGFIPFQYPNGLHPESKVHASVIAILTRHGLWDDDKECVKEEYCKGYLRVKEGLAKGYDRVSEGLAKGCQTLKDKNKNKNKDKDKNKSKGKDSKPVIAPPYKEITEEWNRLAGTSGLARVVVWNTERKRMLAARWREEWFRENWRAIFREVHNNEWCRETQVGITHVLRPKNALRYYEASQVSRPRKARLGERVNPKYSPGEVFQ